MTKTTLESSMKPDTKAIAARARGPLDLNADPLEWQSQLVADRLALCARVEELEFALIDLAAKAEKGHDASDPEVCNLCRALKFVRMELEGT